MRKCVGLGLCEGWIDTFEIGLPAAREARRWREARDFSLLLLDGIKRDLSGTRSFYLYGHV